MRKKLIILFSILTFVAVMIIFNSTVFTVKKISAVVTNVQDTSLCQKIIKNADVPVQSIFFLSEKKIKENVSRSVPEVKVIKIERKFPDKLIIHAYKRTKICYIKYDNVFYILGEDLVVIDIINTRPTGIAELFLYNDVDMINARKGFELDIQTIAKIDLLNLIKCIKNIGYQYFELIQKIHYFRKTNDIYLKTFSGVTIHLSNTERLQEKTVIAFSLYNHTPVYRTSGTISAYIDKDGNLKASYRPEELDF
ncbi:MAG TPA: FtsQ-type POTRA domain-containing protein [Clostridia bacterium]